MADNLQKKAFSGVFWMLLERFGAQGVSFVVTIVLGRLLTPEDYGVVALAMVFTSFMTPFINFGLGAALIQNKNSDELDFSTYFIFNMFMALFLYAALFFAAPFISDFYNNVQMTAILRVIGLNFIVYGVKGVQQNYVNKHMLFKKFFFATLIGTIIAAFVGIAMAYYGFGVWAIVTQNLVNNIIDTIILWITVKWRPKAQFSFTRLKIMVSYGWKILAVNITNTIETEIRSLIIGKVYSPSDLAYYNKGYLFPDVISTCVDSTINSVLFPAFSTASDDKEQMKSMLRRSIRTSIYIIAPMNFGLIACATPLIRLLLTEKWLPCVPFMIIFCIRMIMTPINTENQNAIKAMGRSDIFLVNDIIKKIISIALLFVGMKLGGIMGIAYSYLASGVIAIIINSWYNKKYLNYGLLVQIWDCIPGVLLSCIMFVPIYFITKFGLNDIITIIIQVVVGASIYFILSYLFKIQDFFYILGAVKNLLKKNA